MPPKKKHAPPPTPKPAAPASGLAPVSVPSAVVAILASANESAAMLASDLQRAAWSAEDLGAAEAAAFIERQEMALTAIRDELRKLTGARS